MRLKNIDKISIETPLWHTIDDIIFNGYLLRKTVIGNS